MMVDTATSSSHGASTSLLTSPNQVHLAQNDPFDWETYIAPYKGLARSHRLIHLATNCEELRKPCSEAALELIKETTRDVSTYQAMVTVRNTNPSGSLLPAAERIEADSKWIQATEARNSAEREKLELEMRNYQNNLIKESIRMAHRDLGDHFKNSGEFAEALKCYTKTRDYCSTTEHVVEMCLNVIEVSLRLGNWTNVQTFVSKAEGVLESYVPSGNSGRKLSSLSATGIAPPSKGASTAGGDAIGALFRAGGSSSASTSTHTRPSESAGSSGDNASQTAAKKVVGETSAKLKAAKALACLGHGRYEAAARILVNLDATYANSLSDMLTPSDVAIYVVLCSLASMERSTLKSQIFDNAGFRKFLEYEPYARDLLEASLSTQFEKLGQVLDRHESRHLLDLYLTDHMPRIRKALTRRALRQFFTPFDRISISRMASAFGWDAEKMAEQLVACIQAKDFQNLPGKASDVGDARIDWRTKTLEYRAQDPRQALFEQTLEIGEKRCKENKRLLLRMKLVENGLIAKVAQPSRTEM